MYGQGTASSSGSSDLSSGAVAWGDCDNDRRLDILLAGCNPADGFFTRIDRNGATPAGSPPLPPTGRRLVARPGNAGQRLSWSVQMPPAWERLYGSVQSIGAGYTGSAFSTELMVTPTGVAAVETPSAYVLHANAPNPFNPRTTLSFELPKDGHARLEIFDARGRRVRVLLDAMTAAGRHELDWDGRDGSGRELASGVYLYRLEAGDYRRALRMTLIR